MVSQASRGVFRTHPVVHKRGEDDSVGGWDSVLDELILAVPAVRDFRGYRCRGRSDAGPGHHGTTAELGQPIVIGAISAFCRGGLEDFARDWNNPKGEIWWAIATRQWVRLRGYHEHVIGDPNWGAFYRGADRR